MSLTDHLTSGKTPTYDQLLDELFIAEHDNGALQSAIRDREASLARALDLIETATVLLHADHPRDLKTCLRYACVQMRVERAKVRGW
jgi:hypothetical protein